MELLVLGSTESWYVADLRRAAGDAHRITPLTFRQLASRVTADGLTASSGGRELRSADALLVRTMPPGSLEQVVFRMDVLGRLETAGVPVINPARAIETAVDKYLATARLAAAGLRVPPTFVAQSTEEAMEAFAALGGDAVIKPLFGSEGRGITRLTDEVLAERTFTLLERLGAVIYLQQFVPHRGEDLRLLVIGPRVLGMRRRNAADWRTNVSRGATAEPLKVTPQLAEMARTAAAAVGAPLAGVDLLPGDDGELYAIEVNAVPGWRALAKALEIDVARLVLEQFECMIRKAEPAEVAP